jgi:F-type H+-transporting ATPase subunit gamma
MANAREIKKRIKAVGNIKRITKTMQMIATSKFARAQVRATASKPYTEGIFELVTELAKRAGNISHPLIDGPAGGAKPDAPTVTLVLTSNRGLCGPYNGSVIRLGLHHFREQPTDGPDRIEVVGRKGLSTLRFNKYDVDVHHAQFGDEPRMDDVQRLAQQYLDEFEAGEIKGVRVLYMRFITTARQAPEMLQLLPLKPPVVEGDEAPSGGPASLYGFSPEPEELLSDLLPETVRSTLWQCFSDAVVSENVARMIAMKAATDNAGKMGKNLTRVYNRARQTQITTELTEIIGGAAALE